MKRRRWRGPQYEGEFPTLGWGVLGHAHEHLPSPNDERQPFVFTDEQARRVLRWYEIDPVTGEFVYRRARMEEAKGWGKSPFAGALAIEEFVGPVCFDGWDADGDPVGVPWGTGTRPQPWIQIAAVSEDQTDNTYGALYALLVANEHRAAKLLGIDDGRTRLYLKAQPEARLEPVTASAGSREGQRVTFAVLDETHLWTPRNGGVKLAGTLRRNAAKMGGRTFETTNAPVLGEKSVAEASDDAAGVLHFATRPPEEPSLDWPEERLRAALGVVYDDVPWHDPDRILREIADPETDWNDALRFYFNWRTAGGGKAVDPRLWDARGKPREVPAGSYIGVGFDGSVNRDATVMRGCTADGYSFLIRAWERPTGDAMVRWRNEHPGEEWKVDRRDVDQTVAETFARYTVGRMLCDPPKWWTEIDSWAERYGDQVVLALDTNTPRKFAPAVDRWLTGLREGTHTHDADPLTADHVKATHLRKVKLDSPDDDERTLYLLVRGDENRRIDAAITDVLAHEAAMTMPEQPAAREPLFAWA